jgi:uncharacterized protein with HEPN domain
MRPAERDAALLWDMWNACREIREFMSGVVHEDFVANRMLCLAVERCLEIVGEAASKVSDDFRDAQTDIPWRQIKGMRNILAHEYGQIDYDVVYETAASDIPKLLATLEILATTSSGSG